MNYLKKLGFIVNPIAGMGGRVGLKGTDGEEILRRAIELGAEPVAPKRAKKTLKILECVKDVIQILTYPDEMGENEVKEYRFNSTIIGQIKLEKSSPEDTEKAVERMVEMGVDLILFVGGDGTARNVYEANRENVPVLGVPAGVKMHSAVFAVSPEAAAETAINFLFKGLPVREMEVMDIDEDSFREGRVSAKLYGYMLIPYEPKLIQGTKISSPQTEIEIRNQATIAIYIIELMEPEIIYIIGPGTTTRTIGDLLYEKKTLLGVDLFCNKKIVVRDADESLILNNIRGKKAVIIVTPIGGQGFIFGRGNLQISPKVIREASIENIIVIATRHKLEDVRSFRVDTGDLEIDNKLKGEIKVITGYREEREILIE